MNLTNDEIIFYIVSLASKQEIKLTTLRLVKFVYLFDLYYSNSKGEIATGWKWYFHNFGPYSPSSIDSVNSALKKRLINSTSFESKFSEEDEFNMYSSDCDERLFSQVDKKVPIKVFASISKDIKRFGLDSYKLLNYVYAETAPMIHAKPGDYLEFPKAVFEQQVTTSTKQHSPDLKISRKNAAKILELLKKLEQPNTASHLREPIIDDVYKNALTFLNKQDETSEDCTSGTLDVKNLLSRSG